MKHVILAACTALFTTPALAHDPLVENGQTIHILLDSEQTGGQFGVFTVERGNPGGPPLHIHPEADEAFYIMDGTAEFMIAGERMLVPAGSSVFIPKGVEHTFRILDEDGGKFLAAVTPGGMEGFFPAMVESGFRIPEDTPKIMDLSAGFGQVFIGPLLDGDTDGVPTVSHEEPFTMAGQSIQMLLDADATGGKMTMFTDIMPGPSGPGLHKHPNSDEIFIMLDGDADFVLNGTATVVKEGEAIFIPKGAEHTFRTKSETGGQFLYMTSPGGFEGFFRSILAEKLKMPDDAKRVMELSVQHGQVVVGPPLQPHD